MKVVLQRSGQAIVRVDGEITGSIDKGYVLLVGITHSDTEEDATYLAKKIAGLRLWEDTEGKMNHSILEVGGDGLSSIPVYFVRGCEKGTSPKFHRSGETRASKTAMGILWVKGFERRIKSSNGHFGQ